MSENVPRPPFDESDNGPSTGPISPVSGGSPSKKDYSDFWEEPEGSRFKRGATTPEEEDAAAKAWAEGYKWGPLSTPPPAPPSPAEAAAVPHVEITIAPNSPHSGTKSDQKVAGAPVENSSVASRSAHEDPAYSNLFRDKPDVLVAGEADAEPPRREPSLPPVEHAPTEVHSRLSVRRPDKAYKEYDIRDYEEDLRKDQITQETRSPRRNQLLARLGAAAAFLGVLWLGSMIDLGDDRDGKPNSNPGLSCSGITVRKDGAKPGDYEFRASYAEFNDAELKNITYVVDGEKFTPKNPASYLARDFKTGKKHTIKAVVSGTVPGQGRVEVDCPTERFTADRLVGSN